MPPQYQTDASRPDVVRRKNQNTEYSLGIAKAIDDVSGYGVSHLQQKLLRYIDVSGIDQLFDTETMHINIDAKVTIRFMDFLICAWNTGHIEVWDQNG